MSIFKKKIEEVECSHIYDGYARINDPKRMCNTIWLRCCYCRKTTQIDVTDGLLSDLVKDINANGIKLRFRGEL